MVFVSFLTTAYRTEDYLPATIASVQAQDDADWELVVVDNGCSEPIAQVVRTHAASDPRIRLVRQENRGYVGGVMAASDVATGDFVCLLDSDDQLDPRFVGAMREFTDRHPTADVVGCDAHLFTDTHARPHGRGYLRSIGSHPPAAGGERLSLADVLAGRIPYYGALVRRTAWDDVGGYVTDEPGVDESVDVWLRLVAAHEAWVTPLRLARYRVRHDSLSRHPDSVADFERALVGSFVAHARRHPEDAALVDRTVRTLRYHQALRRARYHFAHDAVTDARGEVRAALAQRRTPRAVLVWLLLHVAPGALRVVHPVKQRTADWVSHHLPQPGEQPLRPGEPARSGRAARRTRSTVGPRRRPPTSP